MLTARDEEVDKLVGLSVGADDYLVKPFASRSADLGQWAARRSPTLPRWRPCC